MGHQQKSEEAKVGHKEEKGGTYDTKKRITTISWIPFKAMPEMYKRIERTMKQVNGNHFGYDGMTITEPAQFTEYPKGGFYDWHMDSEVNCQFEPPVRKISMTILLSPQTEFEGGDLEFMSEGNKPPQLLQGQAIFFCSMIRHRVSKVKKGMRRSLVMWFGGPPFK
jgi:PKHD-type hydroxylase